MALTIVSEPSFFSSAEDLVYKVSTDLIADTVQRLRVDFFMQSGAERLMTSKFYQYFDSDTVEYSFFERAKKYLATALPSAIWQSEYMPLLEGIATEETDGVDGDVIGPYYHFLLNSSAEGFLINGRKFWVSRNGKAVLNVQNVTEADAVVTWQVEIVGKGESAVVNNTNNFLNKSLGSYVIDFSSGAYSGLISSTPYKFIVRAFEEAETQILIDEIVFFFAPESEFYKEFWYLNEHNVWEVFPCMGGERVKLPRDVQEYEYENGFGVQIERTHLSYEVNSQPLKVEELMHYSQLLKSRELYVRDGDAFHRIHITSKSADVADSDIFQGRLTFTYRYAEISR